MKNPIQTAFDRADSIVILAGAGMSVDSGLPDFRGNTGLWTADKQNFIDFADGEAWFERPRATWNFYIQRLIDYRDHVPHRGYTQLLELIQSVNRPYWVVTSNVDQYFARAGYDPDRIYEIHGSLGYIQCTRLCCRTTGAMPQFTRLLEHDSEMPQCSECGNPMRPQVMMFNDAYYCYDRNTEQSRRFLDWEQNAGYILGIELGAGTYVPSIRHFGHERTAQLIRINPHDHTIHRQQDISIPLGAQAGIQELTHILGELA